MKEGGKRFRLVVITIIISSLLLSSFMTGMYVTESRAVDRANGFIKDFVMENCRLNGFDVENHYFIETFNMSMEEYLND